MNQWLGACVGWGGLGWVFDFWLNAGDLAALTFIGFERAFEGNGH